MSAALFAMALVVVGGSPVAARTSVSASYTAHAVATENTQVAKTQRVTATATWLGVSITLHASVRATRHASATRSASVTVRRAAETWHAARAAAKNDARTAARSAAKRSARSAAGTRATAAARRALPPLVVAMRSKFSARALAAAKETAERKQETGGSDASDPGSSDGGSTGSGNRDAGPQTPCGPTIYKSDGSPWTCTFDDEFNGDSLDTSKWTSWHDVNWWSDPNICYYDDPSHLSVADGALHLSVTKLDSSATCDTSPGVTPNYGGAIVHTQDKFVQSYGHFEARIKFGGGNGIHDAYWLWPQDNSYGGHSEIDIGEPYGVMPDHVVGAVHMTDADGEDGGAINYCDLADWADGYHVYGLDWTPSAITFVMDGKKCSTYSNWHQMTGYATTAPFGQDFFMILEASADNGDYAPAPDSSTTFPSTTSVDWVRVWK